MTEPQDDRSLADRLREPKWWDGSLRMRLSFSLTITFSIILVLNLLVGRGMSDDDLWILAGLTVVTGVVFASAVRRNNSRR